MKSSNKRIVQNAAYTKLQQYQKLKDKLLDIMDNLKTISMIRNTIKNQREPYTKSDKGKGIAFDSDTLVTYDHKLMKEIAYDNSLLRNHQRLRYPYRSIYQEIMKHLLSEGNSSKISDFQLLMKSNKINEELLYILMNNNKEAFKQALNGTYHKPVSLQGGIKTKKITTKNKIKNKTNKMKHLKTRSIKRSKKNKTYRR